MSAKERKPDARRRRQVEQLRQRTAVLESRQIAAQQTAPQDRCMAERLLGLYAHDRQLMAYEVHDGFVQSVTAAMLRLQAFEAQWDAEPAKAWESFRVAMSLLRQGLAEARRLSNGLRVTVSDEGDLRSAVERLIAEMPDVGGPPTELCWELQRAELPPRVSHAVLRILQECLTNVARHSRIAKAQVALREHGNCLEVSVTDWGGGFNPHNIPGEHAGLEAIRLRAKLAGGTAQIDTAPGRGTTVVVALPLEAEGTRADQIAARNASRTEEQGNANDY